MKTVAIVSSVGGAGRTTLTAALAGLLASRQHAVLAVECDPRNVLALHFGQRDAASHGLVAHLMAPTGARVDSALQTDDGILLLPWGGARDGDRGPDSDTAAAVATRLQREPRWLSDLLTGVDLASNGVALIDTATWPSVHAAQALTAADLVLVALPLDPLACATLPRLRHELAASGKEHRFVANAVLPTRQLHTDILALLSPVLGASLLPYRIHADTSVPEALARNEDFCRASLHSQTAHDLQGLASWLSAWVTHTTDTAAVVRGGVT